MVTFWISNSGIRLWNCCITSIFCKKNVTKNEAYLLLLRIAISSPIYSELTLI